MARAQAPLIEELKSEGSWIYFSTDKQLDFFNILKKLKRNKAVGYDDIPESLIIDGAKEIAGPLTILINHFLNDAAFPITEKFATLTPVYKSGERTKLGNYRPISVLPIFSKVIERILYQQLYDYLEKSSFVSQRQFGF